MVIAHLRRWLPEYGLLLLGLFFFCRELGTFPGAWLDEGLFIMTARSVAEGHGYGIQLLDKMWYFPYFLAVGPTVILPSALSLALFGTSIAAARVPMVGYLILSSIVFYIFGKKTLGLSAARWSTALLLTLSAFVNTGKPVLGEVPGLFFLLLGIAILEREKNPWKRGALSGLFFGLSFLSKLTYGLILPALALCWIIALCRRRFSDIKALTLSGVVTVIVYLPWRIIESLHTPLGSFTDEIGKFVLGGGDTGLFYTLRENRELLTRMPLLAFGLMLLLGGVGIFLARKKLQGTTLLFISTLIILFTLYFLNSYGWYRHLLPAHILLLPFVPLGIQRLAGKNLSVIGLTAIVVAQGLWQLDHRGSGLGTALAQAVHTVETQYTSTSLLIEDSELFAQLPRNPHWLYLIRDRVSPTMPEAFRIPSPMEHCYRRLRKLNDEERAHYGSSAKEIGGSYAVLPAPDDCPATPMP